MTASAENHQPLSPTAKPDPGDCHVIAIASGKGGVGKTWFAVALSHLLARSGRRTLLFDGDIGLANVDVQLGLTPKCDLARVFSGQATIQDAITHYPPGNFDILAGRSGSTSLAALPMHRLQAVGDELLAYANNYDFVVIDLGAGIDLSVQYLASLASTCLVVVNDEPTSMTDAYAFIKLCVTQENMPEVQIVVNSAPSQKEGEKTYQALHRACNNFLKISPPCAGIIRKDNKIRDAIRAQQSLIEFSPQTTAASDVATISIKLMTKDE